MFRWFYFFVFLLVSWLLLPGNVLETMSAAPAPPDLIFYDMFSTKTSGDQWTLEAPAGAFIDAANGSTVPVTSGWYSQRAKQTDERLG